MFTTKEIDDFLKETTNRFCDGCKSDCKNCYVSDYIDYLFNLQLNKEDMDKEYHWKEELADNGWIDHVCPNCGFKHNTDIHVSLSWNYCPKCGVRMR